MINEDKTFEPFVLNGAVLLLIHDQVEKIKNVRLFQVYYK